MEKNISTKTVNNSIPVVWQGCVGEVVSNTEIPEGICRISELKLKAKITIKNTKYF